MIDRRGLSTADVMDMLKERNVICELLGEGTDVRIRGGLNGIVYYVQFYPPAVEFPSNYTSFCLQAGKNLEMRVKPTALMDICNDLNNEYRYCKFAIGGDVQKFATVAVDFEVHADPEAEFLEKWQWFEKLLLVLAQRVLEAGSADDDTAIELHNRAIHVQWDEQDLPLAFTLFRQAATLGFAGAQNNLGDFYESGEAGPQSEVAAAYWYARAAERGEPTAYMSLATLLSRLAPDEAMLEEATMFAILALHNLPPGTNSTITAACLTGLKTRISGSSLEAAKRRASEWQPLFQEMNVLADVPEAVPGHTTGSGSRH